MRAPQKERVGVRRSRTRRPFRLASGRRQPAAARTAARQVLTRQRDGSACRSGSGRQCDLLGLPDRRARCVRRSTHLRWRPRIYLPMVSAKRSRCTCPNVSASWNASANSARYAPHFDRDRNQFIVVALARLTSVADLFLPSRCGDTSNNVTLRQSADPDLSIGQSRFSSRVAKSPQSEGAHQRARRHRFGVRPAFFERIWISGLRASRSQRDFRSEGEGRSVRRTPAARRCPAPRSLPVP